MLKELIQDEVREFVQDLKESRVSAFFTLALLLVATGYGSFKVYTWFFVRKEVAAQTSFAESFEEYAQVLDVSLDQKQTKDAIEKQWEDLMVVLKAIDQKHGNTVYGDGAKALQVDVLLQEGKTKEALEVLESLCNELSSGSSLYYMYATKRALVMIDAGTVVEGIAQLESLANDVNNKYSDTPAFYLGYYYWSINDVTKAKEVWKQFIVVDQQKPESVSPWAAIVQSKLSQIA